MSGPVTHEVKNRHGLTMQVEVLTQDNPLGLVFIQHGMSGAKDEVQLRTLCQTYYHHQFNVILFDSTNSFNSSDGDLADFTITTHLHDLEDVINWATACDFYRAPFALAGASAGGFTTCHYASRHPEKISHLTLLAPAISGKLRIEAYLQYDPQVFATYQANGYITKTSSRNPVRTANVPWAFLENFCTYDLLADVTGEMPPVFLIVGENDTSIPPAQQQLLFNALQSEKELHILPKAGHTFRTPEELQQLDLHVDRWLQKQTGTI